MQDLSLRQQMAHMTTNMIAVGWDKKKALFEFEREWIVLMLLTAKGNISQAAKDLGIGRTTLQRKMRKFQIPNYMMHGIRRAEAAALRIERRKPIRMAMVENIARV